MNKRHGAVIRNDASRTRGVADIAVAAESALPSKVHLAGATSSSLSTSQLSESEPLSNKDAIPGTRRGKTKEDVAVAAAAAEKVQALDDVPSDGSDNNNNDEAKPMKKKRTWKKPKDKPKRPLSAYNLFFRYERGKLIANNNGNRSNDSSDEDEEHLDTMSGRQDVPFTSSLIKAKSLPQPKRRHRKSHGKIGFAELARTISAKWKSIDPETKQRFEYEAERERTKYKMALMKWKEDSALAKATGNPKQSSDDDAIEDEGAEGEVVDTKIRRNSAHRNNNNNNNNDGLLLLSTALPSPARRISLDYSTVSTSNIAAAAAAAATAVAVNERRSSAEQQGLEGMVAAMQRQNERMALAAASAVGVQPTRHARFDFFPRLHHPNIEQQFPSFYPYPAEAIPPGSIPAGYVVSPSGINPVYTVPTVPTMASVPVHLRMPPPPTHPAAAAAAAAANPLHDLAMCTDLFGRNPMFVGMTAAPPNETMLRNLMMMRSSGENRQRRNGIPQSSPNHNLQNHHHSEL